MSKFTPGPWIMHEHYEAIYPPGAPRIIIAPQGTSVNNELQKANAKLILKSPDMYEYIKNVSMVLETVYDDRNSFADMVEDYINQAQNLLKEIDAD